MNIKTLLDLTCQTVANMIKGARAARGAARRRHSSRAVGSRSLT